ncbi:hypothetical protein P152DRAFT_448111 [Eremomyces bilateralis CBS 781.70]|uniref:BZIP domain-containing protein n=1 Tax=Eremomyces bilateralis CBS 781.70 TaxID=1392243 RepID=A0A6G1G6Y4_9PEZI|nr:uncharacterized protein P152DRAFT_448111 [Eremomyces bilateralis CBS 781.70]KAF1813696.1 hypothetical protein P152DRAFT_448111 [Eremomyces bilateralis CBS 781.70]
MAYITDGLSPPLSSGSSAQSPEYNSSDSSLPPVPHSSHHPVILLRPDASQASSTAKTDHGLPLAASRGPLNGTYHIPPRPKPGRKTVNEVPPTKRKQQNREAQRSFRARRQQQKEQLEQDAVNNKKERDDYEGRLEMASRQLTQQEQVIHGLQQRCEAAEGSAGRMNGELVEMRARLVEAEKTVRGKDEVIERLRRQIQMGSNGSSNAAAHRSYSVDQSYVGQTQYSSEHRRSETTSYPGFSSTPSQTPSSDATELPADAAPFKPSPAKQSKRAPDGCDNCTEDQCPCVEQFTNANPEQKRFCEELSRRRAPLSIREMTNPSDVPPHAKRPRLSAAAAPPPDATPCATETKRGTTLDGDGREVKITCAEAFQVFQSYRETEMREREREEEEEEKRKGFSAFEIGVGEALMAMAAMKSGRKGDVEMGDG